MGLSFLNKKTWHPGSFANIEKVWIAEQKQREKERKEIENRKKLKEERQIEELKKLQVEAGLIPESHLDRLDWMYQGPDRNQNMTTAEEFLLGKPLKEENQEEKKHFTPVFQESYSNPQNEIFTKIHEDPMYLMKKEEFRARKEIEDNPYKMRQIMKEIETKLMKEQKMEKKRRKKEKKEKKEKKKRKRKNSRSDSSSKSSRVSESDNTAVKITTPGLIKAKMASQSVTPQVFGLVDKEGKKIYAAKTYDLGPDENLFKERRDQLEREQSFKQRHTSPSIKSTKSLSAEEKQRLVRDMEEKASLLDDRKRKEYDRGSSRRDERPRERRSSEHYNKKRRHSFRY